MTSGIGRCITFIGISHAAHAATCHQPTHELHFSEKSECDWPWLPARKAEGMRMQSSSSINHHPALPGRSQRNFTIGHGHAIAICNCNKASIFKNQDCLPTYLPCAKCNCF
ncbi:hypothetical protein DFH27DRAFT_522654 [Peziza echinospora]|nr:hypothetical protein DFH27DRAFT_522654 [Peziza echinospora]